MAIIDSTAVGKGFKSAGQLTYRKVRGRVIASQRVTTNKSNTAKQAEQRLSFKQISKALALIGPYLNAAFPKTQYGSSRNYFYKNYKEILHKATALATAQTPYDVMKALVEAELPIFVVGSQAGVNVPEGAEGNTCTSLSINYTLITGREEGEAFIYTFPKTGGISITQGSKMGSQEPGETMTLMTNFTGSKPEGYSVLVAKVDGVLMATKYIIHTTGA